MKTKCQLGGVKEEKRSIGRVKESSNVKGTTVFVFEDSFYFLSPCTYRRCVCTR